MSRDEIIDSVIEEWQEYIEMYPGSEWAMIAQIIAYKLEKEIQTKEYYKRISYERVSTK